MRQVLLAAIAVLAGAAPNLARPDDVALTGQVTSVEEGAMEGVVVSAKQDGATIRISVVTDAQGHYGFPAAKLAPGHYVLSIRAAGYDLDGFGAIDVAGGGAAHADLKLKKTEHLADQLTNADWMASVPVSPMRRGLAGCTNCHTVQRILDSTHTADEFMALIPRMMHYGENSKADHPQYALDRRPTSEPKGDLLRSLAEYYASINRSSGPRSFALKPAPRPTGRATRVIMTEYELPRPDLTEPHDVMVDGDGTVWYSDFAEPVLGELDPKTGHVTEHALPVFKPTQPNGSLNLELDSDGNPWVAMLYQVAVAKFDKRTRELRTYQLPAEFDNPRAQVGMLDPRHLNVDGKVWVDEGGSKTFFRLDPVTGKFEWMKPFKNLPEPTRHSAYGIAADADNNLWFMDYADRNIGRTDKSGTTLIYPVPTPASRPRRGHMTGDGRLAFAEFVGDKIGIFDTKTQQVQEWPVPADFAPYDAVLDKNDDLWTGGMNTDRIFRLDTRTGQSVSYLLPQPTNIRRVFVDNSTTPVTFWIGNNHHGSIVKLEPLD
jgi:virginiamycin B lyase